MNERTYDANRSQASEGGASALEVVDTCPACGCADRVALYRDVPDFVFGATDERWNLGRCRGCDSLYLTERPTAASIGRYYERYYTHSDGTGVEESISGIAIKSSTLTKLANSWRNHRFGTRRPSLGRFGLMCMLAIPPLRRWIEAESRHLPAATDRKRDLRVIDIGCGDARFVRFARDAGCTAVGTDVDPVAVMAAQATGLQVLQGDCAGALKTFGPCSFDYVTLSHVIEHVHEPAKTFRDAYALLRPGGVLWIETPNVRALGHRIFHDRWRDLDPPRHLCIFSMSALVGMAESAGFGDHQKYRRPFVPFEVFPFSARAKWANRRRAATLALSVVAELISVAVPSRSEWITITFQKPTETLPTRPAAREALDGAKDASLDH